MIKYRDKDEVLEEFRNKYVDNVWVDDFIKADEFYRENKEKIDLKLENTFDVLCKTCIKIQQENLKGDINYIYFSVLRTSIKERKGEFRIDFYDESWFLDKNECSINIELDFLYKPLFDLENKLNDKKLEYGRTITDSDIEYIILEESDKYNILGVEFLKDIILNKFIKLSSYQEIKKSEKLKILIGEFMDEAELIYDNDKLECDNQELKGE